MMISIVRTHSQFVTRLLILVVARTTMTAMLVTSATRTPTHAIQPVPIMQNLPGLMKLATTIMTTAFSVGVAVVLQMGAVQVGFLGALKRPCFTL